MAKETKKSSRKRTASVRRQSQDQEKASQTPGLRARFSAWLMDCVRGVWAWSWIASIFFAVVLAAMLGSYSRQDPAFSFSTNAEPANYCGVMGAWVADFMLSAFGFSAWWFVLGSLMSAFFAVRSMVRRCRGERDPLRINPPKLSAGVGFLALLLGSTCLEALRLRRFQTILPGEPGGIVGDSLAFGIQHYIGIGLSTALFFVLIAIGLSLLMDFQWGEVAESVGRAIFRWLIDPVRRAAAYIREKKERRAIRQCEEDQAESLPEQEFESFEGGVALPIFKPEKPTASHQTKSRTVQRSAAAAAPAPVQLGMDLLDDAQVTERPDSDSALEMTSRLIVTKLKSYGIEASVKGAQTGPVITQYWLEPGPGVKGSQIDGVRDDLRRALGVQAVRVVPSIPGTSYIGLEVPNTVRETVRLKEILTSPAYEESRAPLTLALGKDIAGQPFTVDLAKMPHLLVAGTTGSGKSVGINAMILSMLFRNTPSDLRLVLIDPKMLEFSLYNGIPHLLCPVVTDMSKASVALGWLANEMTRRYAVMSRLGMRHFNTYNEKVREAQARGEPMTLSMPGSDSPEPVPLEPWPFIVCIVDELADLMLTNRKEVEGVITRLAQKARAAGIHLIIATQRPSADVVTSLIKANVPTRISFQVASAIDSRVILGAQGAEALLGWGDMLLRRPGTTQATRIQGCFVADDEVLRVVEELKKYGEPQYVNDVTEGESEGEGEAGGGSRRSGEADPLYDKAVDIVLREKRASISFVQRCLGIGYNRSANILEAMEAAGIVSKANSVGRREILVPTRD